MAGSRAGARCHVAYVAKYFLVISTTAIASRQLLATYTRHTGVDSGHRKWSRGAREHAHPGTVANRLTRARHKANWRQLPRSSARPSAPRFSTGDLGSLRKIVGGSAAAQPMASRRE